MEKKVAARLAEFFGLEGRPTDIRELARMLRKRFKGLGGKDGKPIIVGRSDARTRHLIQLENGQRCYVNCALDCLITAVLNRDLLITSSCPDCNGEITIAIKDSAVAYRSHDELLLYLGVDAHGKRDLLAYLCPNINFFISPRHLERWIENREVLGIPLTLEEALAFAAELLS